MIDAESPSGGWLAAAAKRLLASGKGDRAPPSRALEAAPQPSLLPAGRPEEMEGMRRHVQGMLAHPLPAAGLLRSLARPDFPGSPCRICGRRGRTPLHYGGCEERRVLAAQEAADCLRGLRFVEGREAVLPAPALVYYKREGGRDGR